MFFMGFSLNMMSLMGLTLTVGIAATQMNFAQAEGLGFLMAQAVFAGLPTLLVYLAFQKYIVRAVAGLAHGLALRDDGTVWA